MLYRLSYGGIFKCRLLLCTVLVHQQGLEPWAYWLRVSCSSQLSYWCIQKYLLPIISTSALFVNIKIFEALTSELQISFCDGVYLSSRAVSSQVFSTLMSLTSVFGMGTGGSSPPSTPSLLRFLLRTAFWKILYKVSSKPNNNLSKVNLSLTQHLDSIRGQALDRLVLAGLTHHCAYTLSLSTS